MSKSRNNYQGSELFEEKDMPSQEPVEESVNDPTLRMLEAQGKLLSSLSEANKVVEENIRQLDAYSMKMDDLLDKEKVITKRFSNMEFFVHLSPESKQQIEDLHMESLAKFKRELLSTTNAEIARIKSATKGELKDIDIIRMRWWPHGYILAMVLTLLLTIILALVAIIFKC